MEDPDGIRLRVLSGTATTSFHLSPHAFNTEGLVMWRIWPLERMYTGSPL